MLEGILPQATLMLLETTANREAKSLFFSDLPYITRIPAGVWGALSEERSPGVHRSCPAGQGAAPHPSWRCAHCTQWSPFQTEKKCCFVKSIYFILLVFFSVGSAWLPVKSMWDGLLSLEVGCSAVLYEPLGHTASVLHKSYFQREKRWEKCTEGCKHSSSL